MLIGLVAKTRNGILIRYREQNGLTQEQAGELAGVTGARWNRLECMDFPNVSADTANLIAKSIGTTVEEICPAYLKEMNCGEQKTAYQEVETMLLDTTSLYSQLPSPDEYAISQEEEILLEFALRGLKERERKMIEMYYGINGCEKLTLRGIAVQFGLSKGRISQIIHKAERKLYRTMRGHRLGAAPDPG